MSNIAAFQNTAVTLGILDGPGVRLAGERVSAVVSSGKTFGSLWLWGRRFASPKPRWSSCDGDKKRTQASSLWVHRPSAVDT